MQNCYFEELIDHKVIAILCKEKKELATNRLIELFLKLWMILFISIIRQAGTCLVMHYLDYILRQGRIYTMLFP